VQIVWFKRGSARGRSPARLLQASRGRPVAARLWWWSPLLLAAGQGRLLSAPVGLSAAESLEELPPGLAALGQPLAWCGSVSVVEVLGRARRQFRCGGVWSHEGTGNSWTYARDRAGGPVGRKPTGHRLEARPRPFGVFRGLTQHATAAARRWESSHG